MAGSDAVGLKSEDGAPAPRATRARDRVPGEVPMTGRSTSRTRAAVRLAIASLFLLAARPAAAPVVVTVQPTVIGGVEDRDRDGKGDPPLTEPLIKDFAADPSRGVRVGVPDAAARRVWPRSSHGGATDRRGGVKNNANAGH
jgi:hypothetical protein